MYIPPAFAENRPDELLAIMQAASLPILISPTKTGLAATHLPLLVRDQSLIVGHVARANRHWQDFDPEAESMAIFTAMDGYVSPSWYATKAETGRVVPTWNYQAVHATGKLEIIEDPAALLDIVSSLTYRYESGRPRPWKVDDAPKDYLAMQLKGIIGVKLHVTKLEGVAKLNQNKSKADQAGVVQGMEAENPALAAVMRKTLEL